MTTISDCKLIKLPKFHDVRGNLSFVESLDQMPFYIKRAYWIYDVPGGESRGGHAHRELEQLIVAVSGSFKVTINDGSNRQCFLLNRPYQGLYIAPGIWRNVEDFSSGAVCLVLASKEFLPDDYIRNYEDFQAFRKE